MSKSKFSRRSIGHLLGFAMALLVPLSCWSNELYFSGHGMHGMKNRWYSEHLSAMKEPILARSGGDGSYFAFRVLYLPTFGRPRAVRIERRGDLVDFRAVMLSGHGGYEPGEIQKETRKTLSLEEFKEIIQDIENSGFWSLDLNDDVIGFDGSQLVIEAIRGDQHIVFDRWTPEHDTEGRNLAGLVKFYQRLFRKCGLQN